MWLSPKSMNDDRYSYAEHAKQEDDGLNALIGKEFNYRFVNQY